MGRYITTASTPKKTILTTTLGNTGANTKDNVSRVTTLSVDGITLRKNTNNNNYFSNGTVSAQRTSNSSSGILVDPLTDHSLYTFYNDTTSSPSVAVFNGTDLVYASSLNSFNTGTIFCVRIYNGVLYYFSANSSALYVRKVVIATRATSVVTVASGNYQNTVNYGLVYNYLVDGKFWIYGLTSDSTSVFTYNIATDTAATFNTTTSDFSTDNRGMVVNPEGTSVALASYSNPAGVYGVKTITSTSWTFTAGPSGYHYQGWSSYQTVSFQNNSYVFPGLIIWRGSLHINYSAYYYDTLVPHLAATDTQVQVYQPPTGESYTSPFEMYAPHSAIDPNNVICKIGANSTFGIYSVTRNGGNLSFTQLSTDYNSNYIFTRLPGTTLVTYSATSENSSQQAWLASLSVLTPQRDVSWSFVSQISSHNLFNNYTSLSHRFVTSTGAVLILGLFGSSGQGDASCFLSQLPLFTPDRSGTYKVTVIGGGGAGTSSSPVNGTSTTFNGVAAANGQYRQGFNSGGIVFTSGSTAGLAGRGYGEDAWGEGEPPHASGNFGGGSGFVVSTNMNLTAGTPYLYTVGFGPQYGKQGAVIIETT